MAVVKELLRLEENQTLSFGNYELLEKQKLSDFEAAGDIYKVKTFRDITKLERNDLFVFESVPGTTVSQFAANGTKVRFCVEGPQDAQITLGLEDDTEYQVFINGKDEGLVRTGLGGKLALSVELGGMESVLVEVEKQ